MVSKRTNEHTHTNKQITRDSHRIWDLLYYPLNVFRISVCGCVQMCLRTCVSSYGCEVANKTEFLISGKLTEEDFRENPIINWDAILWVNRPTVLWVLQLLLAMVSLTQSLVLTYLGYKVSSEISNCNCCFISNELSSFNYLNHFHLQGNIWQQILSFHFILELVTTIPFALTVSSTLIWIIISIEWVFLYLFADCASAAAQSIHTNFPELLAGQAFAGEHVCKCLFLPFSLSFCNNNNWTIYRTICIEPCRNHNRLCRSSWPFCLPHCCALCSLGKRAD